MSDVFGSNPAVPGTNLFAVFATHPGAGRSLVCNALVERGIRVATVLSLHELRTASDRLRPDVVIVDVSIADQDGVLGLLRAVRAPVIAISVHTPVWRAELLLAGADDCLPALFAPEELAARIIAIARRGSRDAPPAVLVQTGPLRVDVEARRVSMHGSEVCLTAREFDLLDYFVRHYGEVLSRDRLLAEVWGYTVGDASTVTVHVRRLRSKVEADARHPKLIRTVWGIGYRFCDDDDRIETPSSGWEVAAS